MERSLHQRFRNLIVAATGTGKTLISAFDFSRFLNIKPDAKLLFVAHKEEILRQAQAAYRGVLKQSHFGELMVGGVTPNHYKQLFASVQSLNNQLIFSPTFVASSQPKSAYQKPSIVAISAHSNILASTMIQIYAKSLGKMAAMTSPSSPISTPTISSGCRK